MREVNTTRTNRSHMYWPMISLSINALRITSEPNFNLKRQIFLKKDQTHGSIHTSLFEKLPGCLYHPRNSSLKDTWALPKQPNE